MQSSQPLVSVVIPCYNHEEFVQDAIQSVIDQDYKNIELIIIDDGSQDSSVLKIQEMMESCKKRFGRFEFRSRTNIGLSATLNEALEWCEGTYFSAIASDDIMLPKKTEIQVDFLEKNIDYVAVFGGVKIINNNKEIINEQLNKDKQYSFKEIIMHEHDLPAPTQMIRLITIKKVGGYDSRLFIEDWYMWLKLSEKGNIFYISEVFALYRQHDNNISHNLQEMHQGRFKVIECFKDYLHYDDAVKNVKWINSNENFVLNKNTKGFLMLVKINPIKTALRTIAYFEKQLIALFS